MSRSGEVSRAVYVAPGRIDTPMLHRNLWVSKEHGPPDFIDHVQRLGPPTYKEIFVECNDNAFAEAVANGGYVMQSLVQVFSRYKQLRTQRFEAEDGILCPDELADCIAGIVHDPARYPQQGVYVFRAPERQIESRYYSFAEVRPQIS